LNNLNGRTARDLNVGVDVIEIRRFRKKPLNNENLSFYHSIFTKKELLYCMKYSDPYPHIAGIFAAKESLIKCLARPPKMTEIEINHTREGKPLIAIYSRKERNLQAQISITHTRSIAIAIAITNFRFL
jgi:phosphopantetheine--protein transferase-like protein